MTTEMQKNHLQNIKAKNLLNREKNKALIYWASKWSKSYGLAGPRDTVTGATIMCSTTLGTY